MLTVGHDPRNGLEIGRPWLEQLIMSVVIIAFSYPLVFFTKFSSSFKNLDGNLLDISSQRRLVKKLFSEDLGKL